MRRRHDGGIGDILSGYLLLVLHRKINTHPAETQDAGEYQSGEREIRSILIQDQSFEIKVQTPRCAVHVDTSE